MVAQRLPGSLGVIWGRERGAQAWDAKGGALNITKYGVERSSIYSYPFSCISVSWIRKGGEVGRNGWVRGAYTGEEKQRGHGEEENWGILMCEGRACPYLAKSITEASDWLRLVGCKRHLLLTDAFGWPARYYFYFIRYHEIFTNFLSPLIQQQQKIVCHAWGALYYFHIWYSFLGR